MSENKRILVVGDIILDRYITVRTDRVSQESPDIRVWEAVSIDDRLGGAANVANNLKKIGGDSVSVYLRGSFNIDSFDGRRIQKLCDDSDIVVQYPLTNGPDLVKTRWVDKSGKYLARYDHSLKTFPTRDDFFPNISMFDAVVISDYDKGTISEEIARKLCSHPCSIVDSKRADLSCFEGSFVIKLNESEYNVQLQGKPYKAPELLSKHFVKTMGARGSVLSNAEWVNEGKQYICHSETLVSPTKRNAVDPTGCGDTHTAALAHILSRGQDIRDAVIFANECAGIVVEKFGTSTV